MIFKNSRETSYGSLVKRLRRRPLTAETGVRFPYALLTVYVNSPTRLRILAVLEE